MTADCEGWPTFGKAQASISYEPSSYNGYLMRNLEVAYFTQTSNPQLAKQYLISEPLKANFNCNHFQIGTHTVFLLTNILAFGGFVDCSERCCWPMVIDKRLQAARQGLMLFRTTAG